LSEATEKLVPFAVGVFAVLLGWSKHSPPGDVARWCSTTSGSYCTR
jgi:hypothetical protein